jgi:hypothetical protein
MKLNMYIRCRPNPAKNKWKIMVCRSVRSGTKVSQELVKYLGVADTLEQKQALMRLAQAEIRVATTLPESKSKNSNCPRAFLGDMTEIGRTVDGMHDIFGAMFDKTNLRRFFKPYEYERLKDIAICRIAEPNSKRHTAELLTKDYLKPLTPSQIYRLMDVLSPLQIAIKQQVLETSKCFIKDNKIDILFFDVTTLHFESQIVDELRNFGMSKAHKIGEVQVVLALATTSEGLPIGYNLFSVTTLLVSLNEWMNSLNIQDVTVVADRAMMSEANLSAMEQANFKYTVAAKLKTLPKAMKGKILERSQERQATVSRQQMKIQEYVYKGRRLIVSYSESRAKKDRKDREKLLIRIQKKIGSKVKQKSLITHKGYLKYFKEVTQGEMVLNEKKIAEDALWDGLHGVITNDNAATAIQLLERYRGLWVIEESFRINKHTLEMRPIYHFTPRRIEAHILICYIAYAVSRYTQQQISQFHKPMSIERIRDELKKVGSGILEDNVTGERYKMPTSISAEAASIYKSLGIKRLNLPTKFERSKKRSGSKKNHVSDFK